MEIGACDGVAYDSCLGMLKSGWKGLMVEPSPFTFPALVKNCEGLDAVCVNAACGPPNATSVMLHYHPDRPGCETIFEDAAKWWTMHGNPGWLTVEVPCKPLSEVISTHGFDDLDILKIDVESAEGVVMDGWDVHKHRPEILTLEISPRGHAREDTYRERLNKQGYDIAIRTATDDIYVRIP